MKFQARDGTVRLYDGTATPYYLELDFDNGDLSGPFGQPRQEEVLYLHRNVMDANAHYVKGSDEKLMSDLTLTFTATLEDSADTADLLDWIKAMNDGGSTTVSGQTVTSTKSDTQRDGSNNNPAFADSNKMTCNVEYLLDSASGTDIHHTWNEVYFPADEQTITEAADGVTISLTGHIYGTITYDTSGFTSGTDVQA